jgi:hypothetical protein
MLTVVETQFAPVSELTYKYPPLTHVTWTAPVSAATATSCHLFPIISNPAVVDHVAP